MPPVWKKENGAESGEQFGHLRNPLPVGIPDQSARGRKMVRSNESLTIRVE